MVGTTEQIWKPENTCGDWFSHSIMWVRDKTQVVTCGIKHPYLLGDLTGPVARLF